MAPEAPPELSRERHARPRVRLAPEAQPADSFPPVQLFAVACRWPGLDEARVVEALRGAAAGFPELAAGTLEQGASSDGRVAFAAIAHPPERTAPRCYFARNGDQVVFFDGLPLPVFDAAELLERWDELELEGVFNAVKIDLAAGKVEPRLDVFGMAKLFRAEREGGFVMSNSIDALRVMTGAAELDPVGVASMLGFGWVAGGHTLLRDIDVMEGPVTPQSVVPRHTTSTLTAHDVAESLTGLARATAAIEPLTCGLTAGRDTRVVLALALAAGLDVDYYTSGHPADADVVIARELADAFGLRHELITPDVPDDWSAATSAFSTQTDGLASFWIVADWVEHQGMSGPVGLKLWGPGGEIGRAGNIGLSIPFGSTTPGLRSSVEVQRRILHRKVADFGGLVTPEAVETTRDYLDQFIADRLEEGWRPREVSEAYYGFERVRYWASAGVRRASAATDLWSPFVSRDFIRYCLSLTPQERSVEAPHWRILGALDARLRDFRFEYPWRAQRPRLASAMVGRDVARVAARRALRREGGGNGGPPPFGLDWIEAGLPQLRELVAGFPRSSAWAFVDRERLQELLAGQPAARAASAEGLCRALTVLWWLHGRHEAPASRGT
jgi:asparagine synthase (glutamine-hydrolysing)